MSELSISAIVETAFSHDERAIIEHWFDHPTESPPKDSTPGQILATHGLLPSDCLAYPTSAAFVAQIALATVEQSLPQWARINSDIALTILGRHVRPPSERFNRKVQLWPRHLLALNWADSGPGCSWPQDYHATWFPGYGRWVITTSADSTDLWGVCDIALGWFDDSSDFLSGVHDVITGEWLGEGEYPWAELLAGGLITMGTAFAWRDEVWPDHFEE